MSTSILPLIQTQLVRYGMTTILILSNIGNAIIVVVFSKNRKNACSRYLIWAAVMNIAYLSFNIPISVNALTNVDLSSKSLAFCKFRYYIPTVVGQLARFFIVLACIDRCMLTSKHARIRVYSHPSKAVWAMSIMTVFWCIYCFHVAVWTTIKNGRCGQFDSYYVWCNVSIIVTTCLLPPLLMATFGYMAYHNMKQMHARVRPTGTATAASHNNNDLQRQDRELLKMLLTEVCVYIVSASLFPCIAIETTATYYVPKSTERVQVENFIQFFAIFLVYINNATTFFIYMWASKAFRRDVLELFRKFWHRMLRRPELAMHQTRIQMTNH